MKVDRVERVFMQRLREQGRQIDDLQRQLAAREIRDDAPNLQELLDGARRRALLEAYTSVEALAGKDTADLLAQRLLDVPLPSEKAARIAECARE